MMKKVTMVTGNIGKWKIASEIFSKYNITLDQEKLKTPEIQAFDVEEVSKFSAQYAANKLKKSVISSDVGYYIEELKGFPGPFVKYINNILTSEQLLKLMENKSNRTIYLKECLTFATPDGKTKQFLNTEKASLSTISIGEGSSFDKIVIFEEDELPKSMNSKAKNQTHFIKNLKIYDEMAKFLMENEK